MLRAIIWQSEHAPDSARNRLLGLTPAERIERNLRAQGVQEIDWWGDAAAMPQSDNRLTAATPARLRALFQPPDDQAPSAVVLIASHLVYHPEAVPRLLQRASDSNTAQLLGSSARDGLVLIPASAVSSPTPGLVAEALTPQRVAQHASPRPWQGDDAPFAVPLLDDGQRQRARQNLLKLNWRPHDGIIARLVNKHLSVRLSALLADTAITPNQMTTLAFVIALAGIGLTAKGTYLAVLLGATLVQVQSVLDGCDGELARLRYQTSVWGGWYDTVVDDLIGALWIAALGIGSARATGNGIWMLLGLAGGAASVLTAGYIYTVLLRHGGKGHHEFTWWFEEGQPRAGCPNPRALSTWAKYAIRRDFYVFAFFVLAVLGQLTLITALAVAGAAANFAVTAVQFAKRGMTLTRATDASPSATSQT